MRDGREKRVGVGRKRREMGGRREQEYEEKTGGRREQE